MTSELKFKQHISNAAYDFFKIIHLLKLGNLHSVLWSVYPTMEFVERRHNA